MVDTNTLIALAAPMVAFIGSVATLIGVWLTQRSNRQTKVIELEHNRELKLVELREQTARMIRQEKREAYLEALKASRISVGYVVFLGQMSLGQQLAVDERRLDEASERFQALIPELELVSSQRIHALFHELYVATARCQDKMHEETERLHRENAALLDPERFARQKIVETAEWISGQVQTAVQRVFEEQHVQQLYGRFRNAVREELGFMALDPELVPTEEELEALRREIHALPKPDLGGGA